METKSPNPDECIQPLDAAHWSVGGVDVEIKRLKRGHLGDGNIWHMGATMRRKQEIDDIERFIPEEKRDSVPHGNALSELDEKGIALCFPIVGMTTRVDRKNAQISIADEAGAEILLPKTLQSGLQTAVEHPPKGECSELNTTSQGMAA